MLLQMVAMHIQLQEQNLTEYQKEHAMAMIGKWQQIILSFG